MFSEYLWESVNIELGCITKTDIGLQISITNLPFYKKIKLMRKVNIDNSEQYYLVYNNSYFYLNGESAIIHDANDFEKPDINDTTLAEYIKYFCFFIKNVEGSFIIIEDENSKYLDDIRKYIDVSILKKIKPINKFGYDSEFNYLATACIRYGSDLFVAKLQIPRDGKILMMDEEEIWSKNS
jgi:hypothetical protein